MINSGLDSKIKPTKFYEEKKIHQMYRFLGKKNQIRNDYSRSSQAKKFLNPQQNNRRNYTTCCSCTCILLSPCCCECVRLCKLEWGGDVDVGISVLYPDSLNPDPDMDPDPAFQLKPNPNTNPGFLSRLQGKSSAPKREQPALQKMNFIQLFPVFLCHFALLDLQHWWECDTAFVIVYICIHIVSNFPSL
jgi:hypothetical protein